MMVAFVAGSGAATVVPGDQLVYTAGDEIRITGLDGRGSRTLARGESPTWSPDGRTIAFASARVPGNGLDIYLMSANGSDQHRLVMHPGGGGEHPINTADDFAPAWSPRGWEIAFTTKRDGNEEIYSMDPIGHRVQRLTDSPASDRDPAWSPDGRFLAFVSARDGDDEIYTLGPHRDLRRLTHDPRPDRSPAWSPDGRHIVFQSLRDGNWELHAVTGEGTNVRRLTADAADDESPAYSPDGRTIVFTSDRDGTRGLYVMDAVGGPARRITGPNEVADHAAWRPGVDLTVALDGPRALRRGRAAGFAVRVQNRTSTTVYAVAITGRLAPGLRFVTAETGGRCAGQKAIRCAFSQLLPGESKRVVLMLRPRRCGRHALSISAASRQSDRAPADNRRRLRFRVSC